VRASASVRVSGRERERGREREGERGREREGERGREGERERERVRREGERERVCRLVVLVEAFRGVGALISRGASGGVCGGGILLVLFDRRPVRSAEGLGVVRTAADRQASYADYIRPGPRCRCTSSSAVRPHPQIFRPSALLVPSPMWSALPPKQVRRSSLRDEGTSPLLR
jgi:hypothetical protein